MILTNFACVPIIAVGRYRQDGTYESLYLHHPVGIPQEKHGAWKVGRHQAKEKSHETLWVTGPLDANNGCVPFQMLDGPLIFLWDPSITIVSLYMQSLKGLLMLL